MVFKVLRRLSDFAPLEDTGLLLAPLEDVYEMAKENIRARPTALTHPNSEYVPNSVRDSVWRSQGVASYSGRGQCSCHRSLTNEVDALKKQMASMTKQVYMLKQFYSITGVL